MVAAVLRSQAVIEFELDGTIRTANPDFLPVVGHERSDIRGRHHSLFMDPSEAAGSAITAMDHVTQQNAAMVEQSTAASLNLNREAATLSELVGRFQVSENHDQSRPAPIRGAEARIKAFVAASTPVRSTRPRLAAAGGRAEGGWEEF